MKVERKTKKKKSFKIDSLKNQNQFTKNQIASSSSILTLCTKLTKDNIYIYVVENQIDSETFTKQNTPFYLVFKTHRIVKLTSYSYSMEPKPIRKLPNFFLHNYILMFSIDHSKPSFVFESFLNKTSNLTIIHFLQAFSRKH